MKKLSFKYAALVLTPFLATFANANANDNYNTIYWNGDHQDAEIKWSPTGKYADWFKANLPYLYESGNYSYLRILKYGPPARQEKRLSELQDTVYLGVSGKSISDSSPFEVKKLEPQLLLIQKQALEMLEQAYANTRLEVSNQCLHSLSCSKDYTSSFDIKLYDFDKGIYEIGLYATPAATFAYAEDGYWLPEKGFKLQLPMSAAEAEKLYKVENIVIKVSYTLTTDKADPVKLDHYYLDGTEYVRGPKLTKLENIAVEIFDKEIKQSLYRAENVQYVR